jgi:hypothetical protein
MLIAYSNDFKLLMIMVLLAYPLILLIRTNRPAAVVTPAQ